MRKRQALNAHSTVIKTAAVFIFTAFIALPLLLCTVVCRLFLCHFIGIVVGCLPTVPYCRVASSVLFPPSAFTT